ncbi:unnamed protein product [Meloidogyne enterolobii]|uniref:Uncharacterized protein n=1 Tax=Meloidogyne enterolobii TaxID=390850 RepID=A0ACB1A4P1_MELEN
MWLILLWISIISATTINISENETMTYFEVEVNSTTLEFYENENSTTTTMLFLNKTNGTDEGLNGTTTLNEGINGTSNGTLAKPTLKTTPKPTQQLIENKQQNSQSLRCLVGTNPLNKTNRPPPIEPLWCNDTVEYEKRKCLNIVCYTDTYGSFVWKSCGTCAGVRDVWGMSPSFYKHSCKCYECDNEDLCNSSLWNFGKISLIYFSKVFLPLIVAFMLSNI